VMRQRAIQTAPFPLQHKVTVLRLWVLVSAFAFMIEALGAQQISTGKMHAKKNKSFATTELAGRVVAPAGVPVAGVIVSLENLATHQRREAESTVEGTFQLQQIFVALPAGGNEADAKKRLDQVEGKLKAPGADFAAIAQSGTWDHMEPFDPKPPPTTGFTTRT